VYTEHAARRRDARPRCLRKELLALAEQHVILGSGNEFRGIDSQHTRSGLGVRQSRIHAGRPKTSGDVEALHKTILDECWPPASARYIYPRFTGLKRELNTYWSFYNNDRVHHGGLTKGRIPQTSSTVPERWRQDEPHLSAHLGGRPA
jgi:transposase InsO family protein